MQEAVLIKIKERALFADKTQRGPLDLFRIVDNEISTRQLI